MLRDIQVNLVVNMELEKAEGQIIRETKAGPAQARMARKQYKETVELVMAIQGELDKEKGNAGGSSGSAV